jgi:hypothetical protein
VVVMESYACRRVSGGNPLAGVGDSRRFSARRLAGGCTGWVGRFRPEIRSAVGAARGSGRLARGKRPDHASGWGLGSEPDDNVPDVGELSCAVAWGRVDASR